MREHTDKILDLTGAVALRERYDREGRRLVFTNGCFDLLHLGHVTYLEAARRLGDGLLLALNSDRSVRELKGPARPVVAEGQRAAVMAALECVDGVIVFDSLRVDGILRKVKPHLYTKGGDYTAETLNPDERAAVLSGGGEIEIIPFVEGCSSSSVIERIESEALRRAATSPPKPLRAVFLDRDGVLNRENGGVTRPEDLEVLPGAGRALARLARAGVERIVVTNQSGIARGLLDETGLERIHEKLRHQLAVEGGEIGAIYVAPTHPDRDLPGGIPALLGPSFDRKPAPGLIYRAALEHRLRLSECAFVGDSRRDLEAAEAVGVPFFAVRSPKAEDFPAGIELFESLEEVVDRLLPDLHTTP